MTFRRHIAVAWAVLTEGMTVDGRESVAAALREPFPTEETPEQREYRERARRAKENARTYAMLGDRGRIGPAPRPRPAAT